MLKTGAQREVLGEGFQDTSAVLVKLLFVILLLTLLLCYVANSIIMLHMLFNVSSVQQC